MLRLKRANLWLIGIGKNNVLFFIFYSVDIVRKSVIHCFYLWDRLVIDIFLVIRSNFFGFFLIKALKVALIFLNTSQIGFLGVFLMGGARIRFDVDLNVCSSHLIFDVVSWMALCCRGGGKLGVHGHFRNILGPSHGLDLRKIDRRWSLAYRP